MAMCIILGEASGNLSYVRFFLYCFISFLFQAGVTQPTPHWTEEERAHVCQYLAGVMGHVRLLLIGKQIARSLVEE